MHGHADPRQDFDVDTGLGEVRTTTLRWVALASLPSILGFLLLGMQDLSLRERPGMWLVVLSLGLTGLGTYRWSERQPVLAGAILVAGLLGTVSCALAVYPGSQVIFALALASMAAAAFLGLAAFLATAVGLSAAVLTITGQSGGPWGAIDPAAVLLLIWSGGAFSWLATRPTRIALAWAWSSYRQALGKSEELRDRQGELVQLAHALDLSCRRLEQVNRELDRARREAEEARRLKSQFAATISHELRTPLNLVIGFTEMIIRDLRSGAGALPIEHYRGDIEAIYRNACHVSNLVDDVLDLSQVDAQSLALRKQLVSLTSIIKEAAEILGLMFDETGVALRIDLPTDLPEVWADPLRIRQVLINLLQNALRHTDEGEVSITAHRADREVLVSVTDTGLGIPPDEIPRIFDEFQQVGDPGRRRGGSGLGLSVTRRFVEMHVGLSVTRRFVEMHGGSIWAESKLHEGSTFHFSLPLQDQVVATPPTRDWRKFLGSTTEETERTILVVDRDPEPARVFSRYLQRCRIVGVPSLKEASAFASREPAHVVMLTTNAPARNDRLSEELIIPGDPLVITCPIRTKQLLGEDLGVSAYLVKPIEVDALASALRSVSGKVRSVLIVDDDRDMVNLLARMVHQTFRRCRTRQAHTGSDALTSLHSQRPDVVLLDLLMPRMDGYAVLAAMRAEPALQGIPVVVVTARDCEEDLITAPSFSISRSGGLTIGEVVKCTQSCLDAFLAPYPDTSAPVPPAAPPSPPVWPETRPLPTSELASLRG